MVKLINYLFEEDLSTLGKNQPLIDSVIDETLRRFALKSLNGPEESSVFTLPSYFWQYAGANNLEEIAQYFHIYIWIIL